METQKNFGKTFAVLCFYCIICLDFSKHVIMILPIPVAEIVKMYCFLCSFSKTTNGEI